MVQPSCAKVRLVSGPGEYLRQFPHPPLAPKGIKQAGLTKGNDDEFKALRIRMGGRKPCRK